MLGVLIFDTLPGLFIGIGMSLLLLLYRSSRPHVATLGQVPGTPDQWTDIRRHPDNLVPDGIVVLRVESGLFFANADPVHARIRRAAEGMRAVVLDAETVPYVDVTAAEMLAALADELDHEGVRLAIAGDVGRVRDVLRRADREEDAERFYPTVAAAVADLEAPS